MKEIKLTRGEVALVDDQDYDYLMLFKWYASKEHNTYYARSNVRIAVGKWVGIKMHQLVLDRMFGYEENNLIPDHKDRNGLNNQRTNLRLVSHTISCHNRDSWAKSNYRGVHWHILKERWVSHISFGGETKHLGYFDSKIDAAKAYDKEAKEVYGDDAILNFK